MTNFFNLDGQSIFVPITREINDELYEKLLDVVISVQNAALYNKAKKVVLFINFRSGLLRNSYSNIYDAIINLLSTIPRNQIFTVITGDSTQVLELFFLAPKGQRYIFNNTHSTGILDNDFKLMFKDDNEFKEYTKEDYPLTISKSSFSSLDPLIEKHGITVVDKSNIQEMFKAFKNN